MELRFNEPLYNEVLGLTSDILQPGKVILKCMEQNLHITNLEKPKRKIFLDITNKCQQVTKDACETDQQG